MMNNWDQSINICNFEDALGFCLKLVSEYHNGHFALVIKNKKIQSVGIFDRCNDSILEAVNYLEDQSSLIPNSQAVIVSITGEDPDILNEADLQLYIWAQSFLESVKVDLLDYIIINGDLYRSYAFTLTPNQAWN